MNKTQSFLFKQRNFQYLSCDLFVSYQIKIQAVCPLLRVPHWTFLTTGSPEAGPCGDTIPTLSLQTVLVQSQDLRL